MHEEWAAVRRTAEVRVQLTGADELSVLRTATYGPDVRVYYRPYALELACSWPGDKIGHGSVSAHIFANEVHYSGGVSPLGVTLLLSDLEEIPLWLASLVQAAQERCFG